MTEITYEEVKLFLKNHDFTFKPGQRKISYPVIDRIHRRLQQGHVFSNIKVREDKVINDGHHRFISLSLLSLDVSFDPSGENATVADSFEWKDIELDHLDHDTPEKREEYRNRYDSSENNIL